MIKPHCPECKSTEKPHSKITGLKGVKTLIVYCSSCGVILGAVPYVPTEESHQMLPFKPDDAEE